ncbi:MAG: GAF domain-containing SpoIIE family protein phosphatase [bacterium]
METWPADPPGPDSPEDLARLRERVKSLSRLMEVTALISSTLDLDEVMNRVMTLAKEVMEAEAASVMLWNEELECLEFEIAVGQVGVEKLKQFQIKKGQGIAGTVAETGVPLLVADAPSDPRFFARADEETGFVTKSILAAPLITSDRLVGVSEVLNHRAGRPFTEQDLELFAAFCRQVAVAVDNARLHKREVKRRLLDQQMSMAASIQKSFLPDRLPEDERGRFRIGAFSESAQEVGGDLYYAALRPDGRVSICLGDVSGKGVPAALYMARVVSEFRQLCASGKTPCEVLAELNADLFAGKMRGMFVTYLYGILDPDEGEFRMANAGHLPPVCVGPEGAGRWVGEASGPPLGMVPDASYREETLAFSPGESLLIYSDGIVEARSKGGEEWGEARLLEAAGRAGAERLMEGVLKEVRDFGRGAPQSDDMTLVSVSWRG